MPVQTKAGNVLNAPLALGGHSKCYKSHIERKVKSQHDRLIDI